MRRAIALPSRGRGSPDRRGDGNPPTPVHLSLAVMSRRRHTGRPLRLPYCILRRVIRPYSDRLDIRMLVADAPAMRPSAKPFSQASCRSRVVGENGHSLGELNGLVPARHPWTATWARSLSNSTCASRLFCELCKPPSPLASTYAAVWKADLILERSRMSDASRPLAGARLIRSFSRPERRRRAGGV